MNTPSEDTRVRSFVSAARGVARIDETEEHRRRLSEPEPKSVVPWFEETECVLAVDMEMFRFKQCKGSVSGLAKEFCCCMAP